MARRNKRRGKQKPKPAAPLVVKPPVAPAQPTPVPVDDDDDQDVMPPPDDSEPESWELKLEQQAFREGWDTPPEVRRLVITRALDLIDDTTPRGRRFDVGPQARIAAMRVILAADGHNLKARKLELEARKLELDQARQAAQTAPQTPAQPTIDAETVRIAAIRARRSATSLDAEPNQVEPDAKPTAE
jgi:hypothetical protein